MRGMAFACWPGPVVPACLRIVRPHGRGRRISPSGAIGGTVTGHGGASTRRTVTHAADKVDEKGRGFMAKAFDQRRMQALAAKKAAFRAAPLHNVRASKGMGPNKACGHKGGICRQGSKRG